MDLVVDGALTEYARQVLAIEKRAWSSRGEKDGYVLRELGVSPTVFYVDLHRLLDVPEAVAAEPVLVNRLRRVRVAARSRRGMS